MKMNIGTNIKRLRNAASITQEQLAEAMNVTCAAVSKWERGDTYPDITLLQPLAYYFGVTLDELMDYDRERIQAEINDLIALYLKYRHMDFRKAREVIIKAYREHPNDYRVMHYYMWEICGGSADNDPEVLLSHKDEFISICEKILDGCTDESFRLSAWNMRAKILHAEGKTEEALLIYKEKYASWFETCGQKSEQLFAKGTEEYYYHLCKNMYELAAFAGDKLGRAIFFDNGISMQEKVNKTVKYGKLLREFADETGDAFFDVLAEAFLSRMRNDLTYRNGSDEDIIRIADMNFCAAKGISDAMGTNQSLYDAFWRKEIETEGHGDFLHWILSYHLNARYGRRKDLLNNPEFVQVLNKYK